MPSLNNVPHFEGINKEKKLSEISGKSPNYTHYISYKKYIREQEKQDNKNNNPEDILKNLGLSKVKLVSNSSELLKYIQENGLYNNIYTKILKYIPYKKIMIGNEGIYFSYAGKEKLIVRKNGQLTPYFNLYIK